MVLRGDHHPTAVEIDHRMVAAMMAELHLDGSGAGREPEQLVPETDTERGDFARDEFADRCDRIVAGLRIARAVGQKHAVRIHRQDIGC